MLGNIIKRKENKKTSQLRKELKQKENIITFLMCFINDRKEMDIRNLDRIREIERIVFGKMYQDEDFENQLLGLSEEIKSSIGASKTLLNYMDLNKISNIDSTICKNKIQEWRK